MAPEKDSITVLGMFSSHEHLREGIHAMREAGFSPSNVSALFIPSEREEEVIAEEESLTKAPEGTASGTLAGVAVGGAIGWLVGTGAMVVPGLGALIAAGPIAAALAGAGIVGAVGALTGCLIGLGIPEDEAVHYEQHVREGGILLSVLCQDDIERQTAEEIMCSQGARDVSSTRETDLDTPQSSERKASISL